MGEEGKIIAGPRLYGHKSNRNIAASATQTAKQKSGGRWLLSLAMFLCLAVAAAWSWANYQNIPIFAIQSIKINGDYPHVDRTLLRQTVLPFTQRGLLTIDSRSLQDRLKQLPWINTATVKRQWPGTLIINITEQKPVARFNDKTLLSNQGILFAVNDNEVPKGLPLFIAPQGQQGLMLQNYLAMTTVLNSLGIKITILTLDARQSWRLQLDDGIVLLLGRIDPLQRLQRFAAIYSQLVGNRAATINYIDLRYANGIAVNFKNHTE